MAVLAVGHHRRPVRDRAAGAAGVHAGGGAGADPRYAETAIALGASRWRSWLTVLHEARFGVMAAVISGFGRVISEVGCALMVGGNIAGRDAHHHHRDRAGDQQGRVRAGHRAGHRAGALALLMNGALMLLQGERRGGGRRMSAC
jgi:tungstate transport system permease protein